MTFVHAAVDCRTLANPSSDRRRNWRQTPGLSAQDSSVTPHSSIAATSGHGTAAATGLTLLLSLGTPPHITQAIAGHSHVDVTIMIYAHTGMAEQTEALRRPGEAFGPVD